MRIINIKEVMEMENRIRSSNENWIDICPSFLKMTGKEMMTEDYMSSFACMFLNMVKISKATKNVDIFNKWAKTKNLYITLKEN